MIWTETTWGCVREIERVDWFNSSLSFVYEPCFLLPVKHQRWRQLTTYHTVNTLLTFTLCSIASGDVKQRPFPLQTLFLIKPHNLLSCFSQCVLHCCDVQEGVRVSVWSDHFTDTLRLWNSIFNVIKFNDQMNPETSSRRGRSGLISLFVSQWSLKTLCVCVCVCWPQSEPKTRL